MYCTFLLVHCVIIIALNKLSRWRNVNTKIFMQKRRINKVLNVFQVPSLYKEQEEALAQFFPKRDVFINLPTSYGKWLTFPAAPVMADTLFRRRRDQHSSRYFTPKSPYGRSSEKSKQIKFISNLRIGST